MPTAATSIGNSRLGGTSHLLLLSLMAHVYVVSQEPDSGALYKLDAITGDVIWKTSDSVSGAVHGGH